MHRWKTVKPLEGSSTEMFSPFFVVNFVVNSCRNEKAILWKNDSTKFPTKFSTKVGVRWHDTCEQRQTENYADIITPYPDGAIFSIARKMDCKTPKSSRFQIRRTRTEVCSRNRFSRHGTRPDTENYSEIRLIPILRHCLKLAVSNIDHNLWQQQRTSWD